MSADRKTLQALLERMEKATGLDTRLGDDIHAAFNRWPKRGDPGYPHNCAESIDAALALVERVLPGCSSEISYWPRIVGGEQPDNRHANVKLMQLDHAGFGDHRTRSKGAGSTVPLAILAALLKALIAQAPVEANRPMSMPA
jgi:hypothetical protein